MEKVPFITWYHSLPAFRRLVGIFGVIEDVDLSCRCRHRNYQAGVDEEKTKVSQDLT